MMTSGEDLPKNVTSIIEDCGYTNVNEELGYQLDQLFGLPAFPLMNVTSLVTKIRAGYFFGEADAVKQLQKNTRPIFLSMAMRIRLFLIRCWKFCITRPMHQKKSGLFQVPSMRKATKQIQRFIKKNCSFLDKYDHPAVNKKCRFKKNRHFCDPGL